MAFSTSGREGSVADTEFDSQGMPQSFQFPFQLSRHSSVVLQFLVRLNSAKEMLGIVVEQRIFKGQDFAAKPYAQSPHQATKQPSTQHPLSPLSPPPFTISRSSFTASL